MYTYEEFSKLINQYISEQKYARSPQSLYDPIVYDLSLGGKRVRPILMLMAANLYKKEIHTFLSTALAMEICHNFTLLHDDLMDQSERRRGKPTVYKKWSANAAILSGDAMLVLAYKYLAMTKSEKKNEIFDVFSDAILEVCEGQQFDMDYEHRDDVSEEEYITMIRLKTSVLLAASLKIGALLGGASAKDASALYNFGIQIGLSFQLMDDYLDVYGDPQVFGKNLGGDILCNKKTYLLIKALEMADADTKLQLIGWINRDVFVNTEKIIAVTELYNKIGVKEFCLEKMKEYYNNGLQYLEKVSLPAEQKCELKNLSERLLNRNM